MGTIGGKRTPCIAPRLWRLWGRRGARHERPRRRCRNRGCRRTGRWRRCGRGGRCGRGHDAIDRIAQVARRRWGRYRGWRRRRRWRWPGGRTWRRPRRWCGTPGHAVEERNPRETRATAGGRLDLGRRDGRDTQGVRGTGAPERRAAHHGEDAKNHGKSRDEDGDALHDVLSPCTSTPPRRKTQAPGVGSPRVSSLDGAFATRSPRPDRRSRRTRRGTPSATRLR